VRGTPLAARVTSQDLPLINIDPGPRVFMASNQQLDDGQLVRRARKGDEQAFGVLVQRYMRAAYAVARSVTQSHEDAEDATQESFVVALERLDECREPDRFAAWFLTIVRNRSRNLVRRESLRSTDQIPPATEGREPTPDRHMERRELEDRLEQALSELSEVQRSIVLLHDFEGWKHREIAERLGIPSGTVRSHLHFARKALRSALEVVRRASA